MIGLTGAHRTGKTTLARAFSEEMGVQFIETSSSEVFAKMKLSPKMDYPFDIRMDLQEQILESFENKLAGVIGHFITDRTPVDMMAYTLADVKRETLSPEQDARLQAYLHKCLKVTNRVFSILIVVSPGIPLIDEPGKAPITRSYIDHIHHLILGITVSEEVYTAHFIIPKNRLSLDIRIECVDFAINKTVERHMSRLKAAEESGNAIVLH